MNPDESPAELPGRPELPELPHLTGLRNRWNEADLQGSEALAECVYGSPIDGGSDRVI